MHTGKNNYLFCLVSSVICAILVFGVNEEDWKEVCVCVGVGIGGNPTEVHFDVYIGGNVGIAAHKVCG